MKGKSTKCKIKKFSSDFQRRGRGCERLRERLRACQTHPRSIALRSLVQRAELGTLGGDSQRRGPPTAQHTRSSSLLTDGRVLENTSSGSAHSGGAGDAVSFSSSAICRRTVSALCRRTAAPSAGGQQRPLPAVTGTTCMSSL